MIPQELIYQACAVGFAIVLAKHNAPTVLHFEDFGFRSEAERNKAMAKFHRYNNWVKGIFCLMAALLLLPDWKESLFAGVLTGLWIYLVFDIALNKNRPGISWDYLGLNDADGRRWIKWFGKNAGEVKALILLAAIAATNVLKFFIF